jgi:hypothetical protein
MNIFRVFPLLFNRFQKQVIFHSEIFINVMVATDHELSLHSE